MGAKLILLANVVASASALHMPWNYQGWSSQSTTYSTLSDCWSSNLPSTQWTSYWGTGYGTGTSKTNLPWMTGSTSSNYAVSTPPVDTSTMTFINPTAPTVYGSMTTEAFSTASPTASPVASIWPEPKNIRGARNFGRQLPSASTTSAQPGASQVASGPHGAEGGYLYLTGDGTVAQNWPSMNNWLPWQELENLYRPQFGMNCASEYGQVNNSPNETALLFSSIEKYANQTKISIAFALAITWQETGGCIRAPTTGPYLNAGAMQGQYSVSCHGQVQCSADTIDKMVYFAIIGKDSTSDALSVVQAQANNQLPPGADPATAYYRMASLYNGGTFKPNFDNLSAAGPGSTPGYASDVANRLLGWTGWH